MPRALFFLVLTGCLALDRDPPEYYVEATTPDTYFTGQLPDGAQTVLVEFATAPLRDPILEPAPDFTINVVTYYGFGDNVYDGSLGVTELRNPVQGSARWIWSGAAALPSRFPGGAARFVGVQIRGLPYEALKSSPVHEYCLIEAQGLGVGDCGEWIEAILQLLIVCRGIVGEVIDCHGLNWALVPRIVLGGIGTRDPWPGVAMAARDRAFKFFSLPGVIFEIDAEGWRYAQTRRLRGDAAKLEYRGPFRDADAAARDFAETLGALYEGLSFGELLGGPGSALYDEDTEVLLRVLDEHMGRRRQDK